MNIEEKSPLESLKERMLASKTGANTADTEVPFGFTVNVSEAPPEKPHAQAAQPAAAKPFFKIPKRETPAFELDAVTPDAENKTAESNTPAEETAAASEEKEKKKNLSFFKRMRRYTTDDDGVDAVENAKPLYTLDSVNEILGLEPKKSEPEPEVETVPTADEKSGTAGYISDIDNETESRFSQEPAVSDDTATIRFTPITDETAKTAGVAVSTMTRNIDLGAELSAPTVTDADEDEIFEENEFEKFTPKEDVTDEASGKKLLRKLAVNKRRAFLCAAASGFLLFAMMLFLIPPLSNTLLHKTQGAMIACTVIFLLQTAANAEMFLYSFKPSSYKKRNDINACLAAVSVTALLIISCLQGINTYPAAAAGSVILFARALCSFYEASVLYGNLKVVSVKRPKNAVCLIGDNATAMAMAKNSIEGNVLIASSRKTDTVTDYMKYSQYGAKLFGKINIITAVSLLLAVLCGAAAGFIRKSVAEGVYAASVILCVTAVPTVFFIDSLPLHSAASRLNKKGAMLCGFAAAERLEQANAAVIRTCDIFPSGKVTLQKMQVLSNSSVDDILLRAASLTDALQSPLSPIFKRIVGTSSAYSVPDSDSVKYEERLGISGWVGNDLLFIGNRTLMEAHGIKVPDIEFDRKILHDGYFPVYVAKDNKACVVVIIKYSVDPEIAKQLRNVTDLGITLLVDNTDPNVSSEMICDYFDLYPDSVLVMTNAGSKMNKNVTAPTQTASSPAAYRGDSVSLLTVMNCASRIKRSNTLLTVIYVIAAVLGTVYFIYSAFSSGSAAISAAMSLLIYILSVTAVSVAAFFIKRP